jgi:hypothetical protein
MLTGNFKGRHKLEDLFLNGRIILKSFLKTEGKRIEDLEWVQLAQDGVQWCAVVYMVMKFEFHKRLGMFLRT